MDANPINFSHRRSHGVVSPIVPDGRRHKRERLAAQLTWLTDRFEPAAKGRQHDRITGIGGDCTLQLSAGATLAHRVLDPSLSGASVASAVRPLGKLRARIVRHHMQGFGVQFLGIQNPAALRRHFS
jgi:hypothetical protein